MRVQRVLTMALWLAHRPPLLRVASLAPGSGPTLVSQLAPMVASAGAWQQLLVSAPVAALVQAASLLPQAAAEARPGVR